VGEVSITEREVLQRVAVLGARGAEGGEVRALVELLGEALESEVARGRGVAPTTAEIAALDVHASLTSRDPDLLAAMREVFRDDPEGFARQVLAPRITTLKLHASYARGDEEHADARRRIEEAYTRIRRGERPSAVATSIGGESRRFTLGKRAEVPGALAGADVDGGAEPGTSEDPLLALVRELPDGSLYPRIVEDDARFQVIRRIGGRGSEIEVESVVVAKRPYDAWYRERAAVVPLEILDPSLECEVCGTYGEAWWLDAPCRSEHAPATANP
jgi:hypothetical protein